MTKGDIQQKAQTIYDGFWRDDSDAKQLIEEGLREVAVQAYEEAAKVAEDEATDLPPGELARYDEGYDDACKEIATEIRVLKDSLNKG